MCVCGVPPLFICPTLIHTSSPLLHSPQQNLKASLGAERNLRLRIKLECVCMFNVFFFLLI